MQEWKISNINIMLWRNQRQDFVVSSLCSWTSWGIVTQLLITWLLYVSKCLQLSERNFQTATDRNTRPLEIQHTPPCTTFFLSLSSYNPFRNMTTKDILTSPVYSLPTTHVTQSKHRKTQFKDWNLLFSQMFEINSPEVLINRLHMFIKGKPPIAKHFF